MHESRPAYQSFVPPDSGPGQYRTSSTESLTHYPEYCMVQGCHWEGLKGLFPLG